MAGHPRARDKRVLDIYYLVGMFAFLLLLKEFANIQANGNPIRIIQTITILILP
jgi:hypothetical protein